MSENLNDFKSVKLPEPQAYKSGLKVSWNLYQDVKDAQLASVAAAFNGYYRMEQGFDAGYQSPGSITKISAQNRYGNPDYDGFYEVVIL